MEIGEKVKMEGICSQTVMGKQRLDDVMYNKKTMNK